MLLLVTVTVHTIFQLRQNVKHIRVESFKDGISNNLIEFFHHKFKAWYKTKQGFNSFDSANNLISMFMTLYFTNYNLWHIQFQD